MQSGISAELSVLREKCLKAKLACTMYSIVKQHYVPLKEGFSASPRCGTSKRGTSSSQSVGQSPSAVHGKGRSLKLRIKLFQSIETKCNTFNMVYNGFFMNFCSGSKSHNFFKKFSGFATVNLTVILQHKKCSGKHCFRCFFQLHTLFRAFPEKY